MGSVKPFNEHAKAEVDITSQASLEDPSASRSATCKRQKRSVSGGTEDGTEEF